MNGVYWLYLFFGAAAGLSFFEGFRKFTTHNRAWKLSRALFPSWRFFEAPRPIPVVWFRYLETEAEESTDWILCAAFLKRPKSRLFINTAANVRMSIHSLVEQFLTDISDEFSGDIELIEKSVSYSLVSRMIRLYLIENSHKNPGKAFQFKISTGVPGIRETQGEDVFISRREVI